MVPTELPKYLRTISHPVLLSSVSSSILRVYLKIVLPLILGPFSAAMSGPAEGEIRAQQIIKEIVRKHGFVNENTLQLINSWVSQEARQEVGEALLAKDIQIGSSVLM